MTITVSKPSRSAADPWARDRPLHHFTDTDSFTVKDAYEGVAGFGESGSGKTSGLGQMLALAMLRAQFGFLVLCPKRAEADLWVEYCRRAGRAADLRLFGPGHPYRFNALDYLYKARDSRGGGVTENCVAAIMQLAELRDRNRGTGGDSQFFYDSAKQLLCSAIDLLGLAGESVSFAAIAKVIADAAYSPEEVQSKEWQSRSAVNALIDKATTRTDLDDIQRTDLGVAIEYWLLTFPRMDDRTRSGITATVSSVIYSFQRGHLAQLFDTTTNLTPEDSFRGAVIVLDIPVKEYLELGQASQVLFKLLWQRAVERRNLTKYPRPVCLFADEAQLFLTSHDALFQATARSAKVASVLLTQNIDSIRERFPAASAQTAADALLGNFHTKVFCSNGHIGTNEWAAKLIGEEWQTHSNVSASLSGAGSMSTGTVDSRRFLVDPIEFSRLAKGGPENGNMVESIVHRSGTPFTATGTNHLSAAFPQDIT